MDDIMEQLIRECLLSFFVVNFLGDVIEKEVFHIPLQWLMEEKPQV